MELAVPRWTFCLSILSTLLNVRSSKSDEDIKTWTANTNFDNPRNWESGQLPCSNDRVIFPESSVITFMPAYFAVAEMVLPMDGQIIFPLDAELIFTGGEGNEACKAKDVYFNARTDFWYNPDNWNITSARALPNSPSRRNAAVPHAFQIPCRTDKVVFPLDTAFRTYVDFSPTTVASLQINGMDFSNEQFQELLEIHTGKLLFANRPRVRITGTHCNDPAGCMCGNDQPHILSIICDHQTPCAPVECRDPIHPAGHCCPMCGVLMVMKHESNFKMDRLVEFHKSFLDKEKYKGIESFTAKTHEGDVISVFVDGSRSRGSANHVAGLIYNGLVQDIDHANWYSLRSVQIYKSEKWSPEDDNQPFTSNSMPSGAVAAVVILVIGVLSAAVAFYIYKRRYIEGFSFARFDLYSGKIELELGTTPHDELEPDESPTSVPTEEKPSSFDNPIYGTAASSTVLPTLEGSVEDKTYVENPMFMIFDNAEDQEQSDS